MASQEKSQKYAKTPAVSHWAIDVVRDAFQSIGYLYAEQVRSGGLNDVARTKIWFLFGRSYERVYSGTETGLSYKTKLEDVQ